MVFDRKTLVIPDDTNFEEHNIVTNGDVIIGDRCLLQFGVKTDGRIFVGEHVIIDGDLDAAKDVRMDIFSSVGGDVKSGGNVYLGEKVKVRGKLSLRGDLDVGDSVEIDQGFEAKGWINIRSPIPMVIYVFIYLLQLLKMGHSEEIDRILKEMEENEGDTIPISEIFLFIPNNSIIGVQKSKVDSSLRIGKKCKIIGNYDVKGNVVIGDASIVYGTLKSTGNLFCGKKVEIQGNIDSNGEVRIEEKSNVAGNVSGDRIYLSKNTKINGVLNSKKGVSFITRSIKQEAEEKVKRFENDTDIIDEVDEMLE